MDFGSPFSSKVVVCGHCLVTLSRTINETSQMAPIAAHLNAGVILVVTVYRYVCNLPLPLPPYPIPTSPRP